ncbi:MAG TPA: helix-turn-helix domain-containing protein, partial [Thermoleophilaceae bacterium]|nr:helix-turn-helix domain-containing protein [Thermoleophilaceae bacterium]
MPPIGETLREARMRQRLDIADVEERTKIRAKYLRALENEEWGLLPGPTFVKTFLRTYAEVVGVDPYLLVEEYRLTEERSDGPEFQPLAPMPARDRRDRGRG